MLIDFVLLVECVHVYVNPPIHKPRLPGGAVVENPLPMKETQEMWV